MGCQMYKPHTIALIFLLAILLPIQVRAAQGAEKYVSLNEIQTYAQDLERESESVSAVDMVLGPFKAMGQMFSSLIPEGKGPKLGEIEAPEANEGDVAGAHVKWCLWETYKNFKMDHKMYAW